MTDTVEFAVRAVLIGIGAILVMDLWAVLLGQFGVPSLNLASWAAGSGTFRAGAGGTQALRERPRAAANPGSDGVRYAIGITFSALLLGTHGLGWARTPSLRPPLFMGIVTVVAPCSFCNQEWEMGSHPGKRRTLFSTASGAWSRTRSSARTPPGLSFLPRWRSRRSTPARRTSRRFDGWTAKAHIFTMGRGDHGWLRSRATDSRSTRA